MKRTIVYGMLVLCISASLHAGAQTATAEPNNALPAGNHLFLDVHQLQPGKVKASEVAKAHQKDLAVEAKYGVQLLNYWVDEKAGTIFCLASAPDSEALRQTHRDAHGLLPQSIYPVTDGEAAAMMGKKNLYMDIHYLGAGNVTAAAVAGAHQKDLAVEGKYGVNLINYWVNEKDGVVMCLAEAADSTNLIQTHKEAHGLLPNKVFKVKQGQ